MIYIIHIYIYIYTELYAAYLYISIIYKQFIKSKRPIQVLINSNVLISILKRLNPLFYEVSPSPHLYFLPLPFFIFFPTLPSPLSRSFCCLVNLAECVNTPHLLCYFSQWYYGLTLVELWNLNTSKTLFCVLCNMNSNLLKEWHRWHIFCIVLWHTGTDRMTPAYKYILTQPVKCTYQLYIIH